MKETLSHRNFKAGVVHGTFFATGQAFAGPTTILPAFVAILSGSHFLVGLMTTLLLAGEVLPQLFFSHRVEQAARKRPALIFAVYSRALSWLALGAGTLILGEGHPLTLALLFSLLAAFAVGGSLGGVAFMDIIGSTILPAVRGRFFATRQLLGGLAAFGASAVAAQLLQRETAPLSSRYASLFLLSGIALAIAGIGFIAMGEPEPRTPVPRTSWKEYLRHLPSLWKKDAALRRLVLIENLTGAHLMILPFYIVYGQQLLGLAGAVTGQFIMLQVAGGALSNLVWGRISDSFGSPTVLRSCIALGMVAPLIALALGAWAPAFYPLIFLLVGAAVNSRNLSFSNVLVDIAPEGRRSTYTGLTGSLTSPRLLFPLLGGVLVPTVGFEPTFAAVATILAITLFLSLKSPFVDQAVSEHTRLADV